MITRINTVSHLATILGARADRLLDIAAAKDQLYAPFVHVRGTKSRVIDRPLKPLRDLQRQIYRLLLRDFPMPDYVHGGVPGRSIFTAVAPHLRQDVVVACDIREFYPSIQQSAVRDVFLRDLRCGRDAARLLAQLTTYHGVVPQGGPTSMALSNLVMAPADLEIALALSTLGPHVRYTRWVDDVVISGPLKNPHVVFNIVATAIRPLGLKLHRKRSKRRVMRRNVYQHALGVGLNEHLTVSRPYRSKLRAAVYGYARYRRGSLNNIWGRLEFVKNCHPDFARRLVTSLERVANRARRVRRKSRVRSTSFVR